MPSGRDSFRRNRVAPFVLFYFTMLRVGGVLAGRFVDFLNRRNPYRLALQLAFHADAIGSAMRIGHIPLPESGGIIVLAVCHAEERTKQHRKKRYSRYPCD